MVYLNKIYTRTGDSGETSLGDGTRVPKDHPRIVAYGTIDELNSALGTVTALGQPTSQTQSSLRIIQNDLFDVGADLCVPESEEPLEYTPLRVTAEQVTRLEDWIDRANESLSPLTSFILPGGKPASALLHQARTICRRAEVHIYQLLSEERINPQILSYVNRLSDLLFVLARVENDNGTADILWKPGGDGSKIPEE
ncbi:Cob(I)yrinic acid a,c-diamide adenosyltransferase [Thalassoglobus neptunius]|uniref:Corrinoid adenosyltransferase n=1 Tax=Thalassoglobus neptunius TaxID=1938619 RepID=A0A5C5WQC3_9PLAN|nr:cob(I)yrinic acid a,c-diamide adenosyltransferase [Thalassoglobus neptunius]TWT51982.1 Cob(I)yrinic acid a,c-diamide adenosyltransferase [Thalassoglobus neptunius]